MKLHFEPNLNYQHAAIEAVAGTVVCSCSFPRTTSIVLVSTGPARKSADQLLKHPVAFGILAQH
jgi:hypothetical protein